MVTLRVVDGKLVVDKLASPTQAMHDQLTPEQKRQLLLEHANENDLSGVQSLLRAGVDVNFQGAMGETALLLACGDGFDDLVELLVSKGANINLATVDGERPLHRASSFGHTGAMRHLLSAPDFHVNAKNKAGRTALHLAAMQEQVGAVLLLLLDQPGIQIDEEDSDSRSALDSAALKGHRAVVEALVEFGADLTDAIELARYGGHEELARWLESRVKI